MKISKENLWAEVVALQQNEGLSATNIGAGKALGSAAGTDSTAPIAESDDAFGATTLAAAESDSSTQPNKDEGAVLFSTLASLMEQADPVKVERENLLHLIGLLRRVTKGYGFGFGLLDHWSKSHHGTEAELEALWDSAPIAEGGIADLESLVARYQKTAAQADAGNTIGDLKEEDAACGESGSAGGNSERIPAHVRVYLEEKTKAADLSDIPAPIDQATEIVQRLASMKSSDRLRQMRSSAKVLKISVEELEKKVDAVIALQGSADEMGYGAVEPWADQIDPAAVLDEITEAIRRYVVVTPEQAWAGALWITMSWFIDYIEVAPIGLADAPERECGKSRFLEVIGVFVARPLQAANSTPSFIFRAIEAWQVTLLIDEGDTFLRENEELKGIINAGHTRSNAFVGRSVAKGNDFEPKMFSVWGAKAIAGIRMGKHLPESTISRCIVFNLRRKTKDEKVERLRRADHVKFKPLIAKLARFAEDYGHQVQQARPVMPEQLSDRAQDNWEPLFAIASCAGPEWIKRAEQAALALSAKAEGTDSFGPELLTDVQTIFELKKVVKLRSAELLEALVAGSEMAWATYNRGQPLTVRQLAKLLSGYGIKPKTVRLGPHKTYKGYYREDFEDAFTRYLTPKNDPDLRHIAPEGMPALEVADSDRNAAIRNEPEDPDLLAEAEALMAEIAGTPRPSPALDGSGVSDVSGKDADACEGF